jgi:putative zinc finger protein
MSDRHASAHPDELLAGFVDGTLPAEERATVERHVAECARCAEEVSLAAKARSALRTLPLLEAPGLTVKDLHVVTPITKARRWNRVAWGAGIAAAAALVVVFALTSLHPSHTTSGAAGVPAGEKANGPSQQGLPGIVSNGMDYDAQSLSSLASRLVAGSGRFDAQASAANPAVAFGPTEEDAMVSCVQQGAGLDASAVPTYLEVATYQGAPVYVGAFVTQPPAGSGSPSHLLLVVVTPQGCQPVTVVRQPL